MSNKNGLFQIKQKVREELNKSQTENQAKIKSLYQQIQSVKTIISNLYSQSQRTNEKIKLGKKDIELIASKKNQINDYLKRQEKKRAQLNNQLQKMLNAIQLKNQQEQILLNRLKINNQTQNQGEKAEQQKIIWDQTLQKTKVMSQELANLKKEEQKIKSSIKQTEERINKSLKQISDLVKREEQINKSIAANNLQHQKIKQQKQIQLNLIKNTQLKIVQKNKQNQARISKLQQSISYLPKLPQQMTLSISNEGLEYLIKNYDINEPDKNLHWVESYRVQLPIKLSNTGRGSAKPYTLVDMWKQTLKNYSQLPAVYFLSAPDQWKSISYKEYYAQSVKFAQAVISLGITEYSAVMIMGFNSVEWAIAFWGSIFGQFLPVGMYTTNGPDTCEYIANHSEGELIVLQNQYQLKKYYQNIGRCKTVKYFVLYTGQVPTNMPVTFAERVFTWQQFMQQGQQFKPKRKQDTVEYRQGIQKPGNCATFIYTSGTTGMPKAVMISHDNYTWMADAIAFQHDLNRPEYMNGRVLAYLPLSHAAAQIADLLVPVRQGGAVFFPDASVLGTNMVKFLLVSKPTTFLGVPRIWEKIQEKLLDMFSKATGLKKKIIDWAMSIGLQGTFAQIHNKPTPRGWSLAKKLFFNKIKQSLGFEKCHKFFFGAAPLKQSTRLFFLKINFYLINNYGMSELSGPHTITNWRIWNQYQPNFIKQVGQALAGTDIEIEHQDRDGKGQICMRGRNAFMGYFKNVAETKKTIDNKGFVHSGDQGRLDNRGVLYITGRIKELIVTAGGQNIPPVIIENQIHTALPIFSYVVLIGDNRKYLTCLLCLKLKNKDQLSDDIVEYISQKGCTAKTVQQAVKDHNLKRIIQEGIDKANTKAISNAQKVQKFTILPLQFTIDSDILTPTMKLKRKVVSETFSKQIEEMYIDSKL